MLLFTDNDNKFTENELHWGEGGGGIFIKLFHTFLCNSQISTEMYEILFYYPTQNLQRIKNKCDADAHGSFTMEDYGGCGSLNSQ